MISLLKLPLLQVLFPLLGLLWLIALLALYVWSRRILKTQVPSLPPASTPPGHAERMELNRRYLDLALWVMTVAFIPTYATFYYARHPATLLSAMIVAAGVAITLMGILRCRRCMHAIKRLQLQGEGNLLVGTLLNESLRGEFHVFHDVPAGNHTIEHVAIGPTGIFVLRSHIRLRPDVGLDRAGDTVTYDGRMLHFPDGEGKDESAELRRTMNQAELLRAWIAAAHEYHAVRPVLILPGWRISRSSEGAVAILNETELGSLSEGRRVLQPTSIHLIAGEIQRWSRTERAPAQETKVYPAARVTERLQQWADGLVSDSNRNGNSP